MGRTRRRAVEGQAPWARTPEAPAAIHPLVALQRTAGNAAAVELVAQRKAQTKEEARTQVPQHVEPKACFIWHDSSARGYTAMPGTGCAHWISHQLGISRGLKCDVGHSTRVRDVIAGMETKALREVAVGDIWRSTEVASHAGIVREVLEGALLVEHDSTRRKGVVTEKMTSGKFFRPT